MSSPRKTILFTALEPSGDAHAASVIAHLVANYPEVEAVAWGGPRMEAAGARMLGRTADDGVMGIVSMNKVLEVKALHDTMLQSYVLEAHKPHGLESLALRHLSRRPESRRLLSLSL